MTQERLAQLCRVSQSAIGNYESALRSSSRSLLKLAKALGVNAAWLESGQLPMEPTSGGHLLLRDEIQPLAGGTAESDPALITAHDYSRYLALAPQQRQFLRQALRALIDTLEAAAHDDPSAPARPGPRRGPRQP